MTEHKSANQPAPGPEFAEIPFLVSDNVPENEVWLISEGELVTVHVHEGPQAGQDVEVWLRKPQIVKLVNLGESKWRGMP